MPPGDIRQNQLQIGSAPVADTCNKCKTVSMPAHFELNQEFTRSINHRFWISATCYKCKKMQKRNMERMIQKVYFRMVLPIFINVCYHDTQVTNVIQPVLNIECKSISFLKLEAFFIQTNNTCLRCLTSKIWIKSQFILCPYL